MTRDCRRHEMRALALAVAMAVCLAGCVRGGGSLDAGASLRDTAQAVVSAAENSAGASGRPGPAAWNAALSLLSAARNSVTNVVIIDGDALAVVLDSGVFRPYEGVTVTAVQFSNGRESVCHDLARPGTLIDGPCLTTGP